MALYAASHIEAVKPSASAMISQQAQAMRSAGVDVIDLGLGEPDFDTPQHVIEAANRAAKDGQTRYPPTSGTAELKNAIQQKFELDNGLSFATPELIVANGAKQVIFNALMATVDPGDEILLVAPYFDSYRNIIELLRAKRRVIETRAEDSFLLSPHDLEAAITSKTRWLVLNSPSNPAGAAYSLDDLAALGEVLSRHPHVMILADEIYEHIIFDGRTHRSFMSACPDLGDRVLTVNGVSKAYAMTGWRIGYGAGPAELIKSMTTVQSQISSGACSIAQAAAAAALTGPQDCVLEFCKAFERRRNLVVDAILKIEGLDLVTPRGAFYALINCEKIIAHHSELNNDADVASLLLNEPGIATVPGSVYEMPGYFRISTACKDETLTSALDRISSFVEGVFNR